MRETAEELRALQALLEQSIAGANPHLTGIIEPERRLTAARLSADLTGIVVLNLATVTARGEPRLSAVDGHFLHGRFYFTTSGEATKARHLLARPAASVAYTPRDGYGVWAHGRAAFLDRSTPEWAQLDDYLCGVYGESPGNWGDDIVYLRLDPHWMVGYAMTAEQLAEFEAQKAARAAR